MACVTRELKAFGVVVAGVTALAATSFAGATEHVPALVLRCLAVFVCLWLWPSAPKRLPRRDLIAPVLAVLVVVVSLPAAAHLGPALQAVTSVAVVVGIYLTLLATPEDHTAHALVVAGLVGIVHAGWAIVSWASTGAPRGHGGFFSTNDLAAFLAPLAILGTVHVLLPSPSLDPARRRLVGLGALVLCLGVVATGSRAGLVSLGAGLVVLAATRAWRIAVPAVVALALVVLLVSGLRTRFTGAGDAFAFNRIDIWRASVDVALHEPIGVGIGGYASALRQHGVPLEGLVRYPKTATDAHCEPLTALVELGPAGLAATLLPPIFLLTVIIGRFRRRSVGG